jgi:hypothetical protein
MRIVGFGDSFISKNDKTGYLDIVGKKLNADIKWHGLPGAGIWDSFFQFKDYPHNIDVAVFAWSSPSRFFHPNVRGICHGSVQLMKPGMPNFETWEAARQYYYYLYDWRKTEYEAMAFFQWFDEWSKRYANIKFIHMWSFSKDTEFNETWEKYKHNSTKLEYHHRWQNGVEIRPALMHFSAREGWPENNNFSRETRNNHLSETYHAHLADIIVDAVNNYQPGKLYAPE